MKPTGQKNWSAGTRLGQITSRIYQVKIDESIYKRNRLQLIHAYEPHNPDTQEHIDPESIIALSGVDKPETTAAIIPVPQTQPDLPCRSQLKHKLHIWLNDHVPR